MRRWQTSVRPSSSSTTRYLPRRPTRCTTAPQQLVGDRHAGRPAPSAGRRGCRHSTARGRPAPRSSPRRTVSTSGSSGIDVSQQQRPVGRHVADLEAPATASVGLARACTVASGSPASTAVAALAVHHARRPRGRSESPFAGAAGAQPHRLLADAARRGQRWTVAGARRRHLDHERRARPAGRRGRRPGRGDPAVVALVAPRPTPARGAPPLVARPASVAWSQRQLPRSAGPPPRSVATASSTSSALPTAQPSGSSMGETQRVGLDAVAAAQPHHQARPARGRRRSGSSAPSPDLDVEQQPASRRMRSSWP